MQELYQGLIDVIQETRDVEERCVMHVFAVPDAEMYARHGLGRRLGVLRRSVERVYELLPPDLDAVPERETTFEATAHIQAFIMNAFGACDNLAWIWVSERDVKQANGNPLLQTMVGLGERYGRVRGALTQPLLDLLDQRKAWFGYLKDFRDALAHRVPLYIPPFTVDPDEGAQHTALDQATKQALLAGDLAVYQQRKAERDALRHFQPIMSHALGPSSQPIRFHPQLQADITTVNELARAFFDAL